MGGFAEILAGIGQAAQEDRLKQQEDEGKRVSWLSKTLYDLSSDPYNTPEQKNELLQAAFGAQQGKMKSKQLEKLFTDSIRRLQTAPEMQSRAVPPPPGGEAASMAMEVGEPVPGVQPIPAPPGGAAPVAAPVAASDPFAFLPTNSPIQREARTKLVMAEAEEAARARGRATTEKDKLAADRKHREDVARRLRNQEITSDEANILLGERLIIPPPPTTQTQVTLQRFEGALASDPKKKVLFVWNPKENTFTMGGQPVAANQVIPPPDQGSIDSVPAQERRDALESYAARIGKTVADLGADDRTQAVIDYKARTAPVFSSSGFVLVPQPDGSIQAVSLTRTSQRSFPGASPAAPATGGGGGTAPATPARGGGQAKPAAGAGGPGRVVGGRELPPELQRIKANATSGIAAIAKIRSELKKDPEALLKEPLGGSRVFATYKREAMDVLTRLRTGAALNQDEEKFYKEQFPNWKDYLIDPAAVEAKLSMYDELFRRLQGGAPAPPASSGNPYR